MSNVPIFIWVKSISSLYLLILIPVYLAFAPQSLENSPCFQSEVLARQNYGWPLGRYRVFFLAGCLIFPAYRVFHLYHFFTKIFHPD
ncbi:membrane protein [Beggiatoa sp. SS]|nr:membrane protein [Beggiatoa sp. SS]